MVPTARRPGITPSLVTAIVLTSLNLRAAIASAPPLLDEIEQALRLTGGSVGLLTTLPVLCMGVLAPLADRLISKVGEVPAVDIALVLLAGGLIARVAADSVVALFGGTVCAGTGIAIVGVVLPRFVRTHFVERAGVMTALYVVGLGGGAALAAALAAPLADLFGSWRTSLGLWAVPAVAAGLVWHWGMQPFATRTAAPRTDGVVAVWYSRTAWLITGYLVVQAFAFYGAMTWLAPAYVTHGYSATAAGGLLSVVMAAQIVGLVVMPVLAERSWDRRLHYASMVGSAAIGLSWIIVVPLAAPWIAAVVLGIGLGGGFALGLLLLVDHARTPAASGRLTAMAFLIAYGAAAVAPVLLGALRDATGGYRIPFMILLVAMIIELGILWTFTPERRTRGV